MFPYEIHLTLEDVTNIDALSDYCKKIGNVKPVILDLYTNKNTYHQVTTSTTLHDLDNANLAMDHAIHLVQNFSIAGYKVSRVKLETVPWNPMTRGDTTTQKNTYFETHYTFEVDEKREVELRKTCGQGKLKLSRNCLKVDKEGTKKYMGTLRTYNNPLTIHEEELHDAERWMADNDFNFLKKITEYAWYDSNVRLDKEWLEA
jgi:hypothetical protein